MLLILFKITVLLALCLVVSRTKYLTAAQKHLIMLVSLACLPLLVFSALLPHSWGLPHPNLALPDFVAPMLDFNNLSLPRPDGPPASLPLSSDVYLSWSTVLLASGLLVSTLLLMIWAWRIRASLQLLSANRSAQPLALPGSCPDTPIYTSSQVSSPVALGFVQGVILLPTHWHTWSGAELHAVILHERAHIQRRDTLTQAIVDMLGCFMWWHPMYYLVRKDIRLQAEIACDDWVVTDTQAPVQYATTLLRLARAQRGHPIQRGVAMASASSLPTRIHLLLNPNHRRKVMNRTAQIRWGLMTLIMLLPLLFLRNSIAEETSPRLSPDGHVLPIVKVAPAYPAAAKADGIEGYVILEFTVDEEGKATNAHVVEAQPKGVFDAAALDAIRYYRYKPAVEQGQAIATPAVRNRITFALRGGASVEHQQPKPRDISRATLDRLSQAHDAISDKNYSHADQLMGQLKQDTGDMNANEAAQVFNLAGFLAYSRGDFDTAVNEYKQVISHPDSIPKGLYGTTLYTLAQLTFVTKDYPSSLGYMHQWQDNAETPGPIPLIFMAQVNYQMQDFAEAISLMEAGLAEARQRDVAVRENWLLLLTYLYHEESRWRDTLDTLQQLNQLYPKPEYQQRIQAMQQKLIDAA